MASAFGFDFSGAAAGQVGLGVAGAITSFGAASGRRAVASANAEAANIVRAAQNTQRIAQNNLALTVRRINNDRRLAYASKAQDTSTQTILRAQEAFAAGRIEQGLRQAEQLGAGVARAAAAGVGGSSVLAYQQALEGKQARLEQFQEENFADSQEDMFRQRADIFERGLQSVDFSPTTTTLDRSNNVGPGGSVFGDLLGAMTGALIGNEQQRSTLNTLLGSIKPSATLPTQSFGERPLGPSDALGTGTALLDSPRFDQFFTQPDFGAGSSFNIL